MIERLNWDSEFFGYPVGRIVFKEHDESLLSDENEIKNFRLIYLFSDKKRLPNDPRINEVDIKTTLVKQIKNEDKYPIHASIAEYSGGKDKELIALALESGVFSRFKSDPEFINDEYAKLYTKWITDSINMKIADKLFVYVTNDHIEGFVSLKFKETYAEIGLIAVHSDSRGKGVAMSLLTAAFQATKNQKLPCIRIVTQFANTPAMKLYQKSGFVIENKKYIYHLWNKQAL